MVSLWDFMKLSKTRHNTIKLFCKSSNNSTFLITVREGNGRNAPLTDYRLDLVNPNQPVLTRL